MGLRHKAREIALQYLYQRDLKLESTTDDVGAFSVYYKVADGLDDFFREIVAGVEKSRLEIDASIEAVAENWKLYRMAKVDLAILRIASWELRAHPELDYQVVIDEAIELAKTYGSTESAAFVNGILDKLAKSRNAENSAAVASEILVSTAAS